MLSMPDMWVSRLARVLRSAFGALLPLAILGPLTVPTEAHAQRVVHLMSIDSAGRLAPFSDRSRSIDSAVEAVQRWYNSHGYFKARWIKRNGDTVESTSGPRFRVGEFELIGDVVPGAEEVINRVVPYYYSDDSVSLILDTLLRHVSLGGYPAARLTIERLDLESGTGVVDVVIDMDRGEQVVIERVEFVTGSGASANSYLARASGLRVNQVFSEEAIARARARLYRTGLFEPVAPPDIVRVDSGGYILRFTLQERSVNTFDGAIGYQPGRQEGEDGFFAGSIAIGLRNLFGGGERIEGAWRRLDEATAALMLSVEVPYVFNTPFGLEISYQQNDERESTLFTAYLQREFRATATLELGSRWRLEGGGVISGVIPAPDTLLGPCSRRLVPRTGRFGGTTALQYDSRDLPLNPRRGSFARGEFEVASRTTETPECDTIVSGTGSRSRQYLLATLAHYHALGGPLVLAATTTGRLVNGEALDVTELYRIGGTNTVRGYREGQFRGARNLSGSVEARAILSERSHAGLFLDAGYTVSPILAGAIESAPSQVLLGYGVSMQVDTPAGIARVSVGLAEGSSPEEATVSVGLVGSF